MPTRLRCVPLLLLALLLPPAGADETTPTAKESLSVTLVNGNYEITLPQSKLLIRIPANGLTSATTIPGSGTDSAAYFELACPLPNMIIAGWLEPAGNYDGVQKLWKSEAKAMTEDGRPAPRNIVFLKRGKWEVISYHIPLPQGTNAHLRAELVQAGTWLDLHFSVTSEQPASAARDKILAVLQSITVEEK